MTCSAFFFPSFVFFFPSVSSVVPQECGVSMRGWKLMNIASHSTYWVLWPLSSCYSLPYSSARSCLVIISVLKRLEPESESS